MSYLTPPQIHFKGQAYCNPSTADNNDLANVFDIDTLEITPVMDVYQGATVEDPAGQQTFNYQGASSAPDCRTWLMGLMNNTPDRWPDGTTYGQQAHWNYYGDHATRLDETEITSIISPSGQPYPSTDPLNRAAISLIGTPSSMQFQDPVIVDNDPYALITSQVFSHGIEVTAADGTKLISASPATRCYAYYINIFKNLDPNASGFQPVSAVFFAGIPNSGNITINNSVNSQALDDFASAIQKGAGLQMRFIFYDALCKIKPTDLYALFSSGKYPPNPYIGLTLGTIGLLDPDEMLSAPPGRKLNHQSGGFKWNPAAPCVAAPSGTKSGMLGITQAEVDTSAQVVYLDCVSTFPECNVDSNQKFSFGSQLPQLMLLPQAGAPIFVGNIPNDVNSYVNTAGMVTINYSTNPQASDISNNITTGRLAIYDPNQPTGSQSMLEESPYLDIETEDRAIYFDVKTLSNWSDPNEQPVPGTSTISIQVFRQGVPVQDSVTINLEHWMCAKDFIDPSKPQCPVKARYFTIAEASPLPNTQYSNGFYNPTIPQSWSNQPAYSVITDQVTIPANSDGKLTLHLSGVNSGTSLLRLVDPNNQFFANFCWDNTNYACIRILPFDDYRSYSDGEINNWPFIYANFFNYFALLYPVMSKVIPWGPDDAPDNPKRVATFASNIRTFTDPINWDSTIYMPVTRDLSAGKRALLWRWCALQPT